MIVRKPHILWRILIAPTLALPPILAWRWVMLRWPFLPKEDEVAALVEHLYRSEPALWRAYWDAPEDARLAVLRKAGRPLFT